MTQRHHQGSVQHRTGTAQVRVGRRFVAPEDPVDAIEGLGGRPAKVELAATQRCRPAMSVDAAAVLTDRVDTCGAVAEAAGVVLGATIPATP